jgi:hypothetical protein
MAKTPDFKYAPMFQIGEDKTEYRLISKEGVSTAEFEGKTILKVSKEALTLLAQQGFHDVEFKLRREHNLQVAKILSDPEASENDKYVALQFLRNAETAVKGILPFCQDTGTAIIHGEKGQRVWTDFEDEEALSLGVYNTFTQDNYSWVEKEEDDLTPMEKENIPLEDLKKTWMAKLNEDCLFISAKNKENIDEFREILYKKVRELHVQKYPYNDFLYQDYE